MSKILGRARLQGSPNPEGADKPLKSPVPQDVSRRAPTASGGSSDAVTHDCAAILLYDPCNIRYAIDACNMQVWMPHNASHYAFVGADGYAVDFE